MIYTFCAYIINKCEERSYKEDKACTFKNFLQGQQYSLKSKQFLILTGKSFKTMAEELY